MIPTRRLWAGLLLVALLLALLLAPARVSLAQSDESPPAPIENEEGGATILRGSMDYSNPIITMGVAQPLIVLEDQAGFVDRNKGFLFPPESQVLGQILGDFFEPPFEWTLSLPAEPQGTLRDVDNDDQSEPGVMVFAVAYWTNAFGDAYLEQRDQGGGGWSTAFATTEATNDPSGKGELVGGKLIVWAPDDQQGFPSGFGEDGKLFTADDPVVRLPAGYTIVDLDSDPFVFDRSRYPELTLIEPESLTLDDFSELSYTEAFDAMLDLFADKYAFTELKGIDWSAKAAEFRPLFEAAEADADALAYRRALRDFIWSIPDGHLRAPLLQEEFVEVTRGGVGIAIRDVEDESTIVSFVTPDSPADRAGIERGAVILTWNGQPIDEYVDSIVPFSSPFSAEHVRRLQQLRYATRAPVGSEVEVTFQNPGDTAIKTALITADVESESFRASSFNIGRTGTELPVEFRLLDNGLGYVKLYSFSDNELLTVQLWERMLEALNSNGLPGLIIDMRQNGGGSGFLADQMAAYFFDEAKELGKSGYYDEELEDFYFDPDRVDRMYLPDETLRYSGPVAVITGPNCASACEFFTYNMALDGRSEIVAHYPTAGLGGSQNFFLMPESEFLQISIGRPVDMDGHIIIEDVGVPPTLRVPVTAASLFAEGDPLLETAIAALTGGDLPYDAQRFEGSALSQQPAPAEEATPAPSEEATPAPSEEAGAVIVTIVSSGRVIVRPQPAATGILGVVNNGESYTLLERSADGNWVKIDFGDDGGWISASLVQINE